MENWTQNRIKRQKQKMLKNKNMHGKLENYQGYTTKDVYIICFFSTFW